jgi:hypothetical protein
MRRDIDLPDFDDEEEFEDFIEYQEREEQARAERNAQVQQLLQQMPPEAFLERLKGILSRVCPFIVSCEEGEMDGGERMLMTAADMMLGGLVDAVRWVALHYDIDLNLPFGDDNIDLELSGLKLGVPPEEMLKPEPKKGKPKPKAEKAGDESVW